MRSVVGIKGLVEDGTFAASEASFHSAYIFPGQLLSGSFLTAQQASQNAFERVCGKWVACS